MEEQRVIISSPFYEGYLDEISEEDKLAIIADNPNTASMFEDDE